MKTRNAQIVKLEARSAALLNLAREFDAEEDFESAQAMRDVASRLLHEAATLRLKNSRQNKPNPARPA